MTNLLELIVLFEKIGIGFTMDKSPTSTTVTLSKGDEKVEGYQMFYCEFRFDEHGKFVNAVIAE